QIPGVGQNELQYNFKSKLVQDVRVRQAIYSGFDRRSVLNNQLGGAGRILWTSAGFNPDGQGLDQYEYNLDKAKQLLQAAVQAGTFDQSAVFRVIYIQDFSGWQVIANALGQALKDIGIQNVELAPMDNAAWQNAVGRDDSYAVTLQCCG